jgi:hypothetical protein
MRNMLPLESMVSEQCHISHAFCEKNLTWGHKEDSQFILQNGRILIKFNSVVNSLSVLCSYRFDMECFPGGKSDGAWNWPLTSIWSQVQEQLSYTFTPRLSSCLNNTQRQLHLLQLFLLKKLQSKFIAFSKGLQHINLLRIVDIGSLKSTTFT